MWNDYWSEISENLLEYLSAIVPGIVAEVFIAELENYLLSGGIELLIDYVAEMEDWDSGFDMRPGSNFLQELYSDLQNEETIERFAIIGLEDEWQCYRNWGTNAYDNEEIFVGLISALIVSSYNYFYTAVANYENFTFWMNYFWDEYEYAYDYANNYCPTNDCYEYYMDLADDYYYNYSYFYFEAVMAWNFAELTYYQNTEYFAIPEEWNDLVLLDDGTGNDAIVPAHSQRWPNIGDLNYYEAQGANHSEEQNHDQVTYNLRQIAISQYFRNEDGQNEYSPNQILFGNVTISQDWNIYLGGKLTIYPGTVLNFENNSKINIEGGELVIAGTEAEPVTLTSNGQWVGIEVNSNGSISIENAMIEKAQTAINFWHYFGESNGGESIIKNTTFQNNTVDINYYWQFAWQSDPSPLTIDNCTFDGTNGGYGLFFMSTNRPITIINSIFNNTYLNGFDIFGNFTVNNNQFYSSNHPVGIGLRAHGNIAINRNLIEGGNYASIYIDEPIWSNYSSQQLPSELLDEIEAFQMENNIDESYVKEMIVNQRDVSFYTIQNNTLLQMGIDVDICFDIYQCASVYNIDIRNNIISGSSSYGILISDYAGLEGSNSTFDYGYNDIYGFNNPYMGYGDPPLGIGDIVADPLLTEDYHLQPDSPCRNSGDPSIFDFDCTVSDIGAYPYYQPIMGDVSIDCQVDILDVLLEVDYVLGRTVFSEYQLLAGDMNYDGSIDIADVLMIVDRVLGQPVRRKTAPARAKSSSKNNESIASVNLINSAENRSVKTMSHSQMDVVINSDIPLSIVHLELLFDTTRTSIDSLFLTDLANAFAVRDSMRGDTLAFMVFSLESGIIDTGEVTLATILFSESAGKMLFNDDLVSNELFTISGADAADIYGNRVSIFFREETELSNHEQFVLHPAYPNPFNPLTTISYNLPFDSHVRLAIFDLLGREIIQIENNYKTAGRHNIVWNGRNIFDKQVSSGIYIYRISVITNKNQTRFSNSQKLILLKY